MSQKKRGLGRDLGDLGLGELLKGMPSIVDPVAGEPGEVSHDEAMADRIQMIAVNQISPGLYQPRKTMDQAALQELAESIRSQGIIQPLILRSKDDGYEIIGGERRWRAAQIAELQQVPAIVRDITDKTAIAIALIENIQRRDLNAIEEAVALQQLIDQFTLTHQEVAKLLGKSRTRITNLLRLLKLNPDVRILVEKSHIEMGHARALLALEGLDQSEAATKVVRLGLSVRQTETLVRDLQKKQTDGPLKTKLDPNIVKLQNELSEKFGAPVNIRHGAKGKGKLIVQYHSLDELEGILEKVR